ncbi:MAG: eCIS core domain-containing protein [Actinomycetota bacterium]
MIPVLRALAYLWALPGTMIGLVLGASTFSRPRVRDGALAFESARGFGALHRRMGFAAITFGHVVVANRALDERLWAHELVHVRQWELLGPVMLVAYPLASVAGYRRNPFEAAARRKAGA